MKQITKEQYQKLYSKLDNEKKAYIELPTSYECDIMIVGRRDNNKDGTIVAGARIQRTKNNHYWIHGLISLKKGEGKKLVEDIIDFLKERHEDLDFAIRLNCIGNGLLEYYREELEFSILFSENCYINGFEGKLLFHEMIYYPH